MVCGGRGGGGEGEGGRTMWNSGVPDQVCIVIVSRLLYFVIFVGTKADMNSSYKLYL